jgi:hypothetical protein
MFNISENTLERLRQEYLPGTRVELTKMNDPYRTDLVPGCLGTVLFVDDTGSIHVRWDCGSSLAVVFGEDACRVLKNQQEHNI